MKFRILLIALISTTVAQEQKVQHATGIQQAQIKYHDPNGLKVDWKLFAPQTQWRANLQTSQQPQQEGIVHQQQPIVNRPHQSQLVQVEQEQLQQQQQQQRYLQSQVQPEVETDLNQVQYKSYVQPQVTEQQSAQHQLQYRAYPQPQTQVEAQQDPNQVHYNRYEAPSHLKQVILDNYKDQRPYVDQSSLVYSSNEAVPQQYDHQSANAEVPHYEQSPVSYEHIDQQKSRREYIDRDTQGRIVYKEEYEQLQQQQHQQQQQQEAQVEHVPTSIQGLPVVPPGKLVFDKNMPRDIQQLLQFQAQLPYDVIANSISYRPKKLFIPKPLPSDIKGPYHYRSKIYYVNNDRYEDDSEGIKPIEEEQRH